GRGSLGVSMPRKEVAFRPEGRSFDSVRGMFMKLTTLALTAAVVLTGAASGALAADISGAGASFPYPIYTKWAYAYKKQTNIGLKYRSIGSGGDIKQIKARTVTFGATDEPLSSKDLDESDLVQFHMVMGGIVPVVNLDGIKS